MANPTMANPTMANPTTANPSLKGCCTPQEFLDSAAAGGVDLDDSPNPVSRNSGPAAFTGSILRPGSAWPGRPARPQLHLTGRVGKQVPSPARDRSAEIIPGVSGETDLGICGRLVESRVYQGWCIGRVRSPVCGEWTANIASAKFQSTGFGAIINLKLSYSARIGLLTLSILSSAAFCAGQNAPQTQPSDPAPSAPSPPTASPSQD